jgi:hypothetical protein
MARCLALRRRTYHAPQLLLSSAYLFVQSR